jgi:hypothetical protein
MYIIFDNSISTFFKVSQIRVATRIFYKFPFWCAPEISFLDKKIYVTLVISTSLKDRVSTQ